jgi:transposase
MIHLTANTPIQVATERVDFRKGIDGFVALCQYHLAQNPRSGTRYVFLNRNATMIRILAYDHHGAGYWLMTKRLSKGRFRGWPQTASPLSPLAAHRLRQLFTGLLESGDD